MDLNGICKGVVIDGEDLGPVVFANIVMKPGDITRLHVEFLVSTVETIRV